VPATLNSSHYAPGLCQLRLAILLLTKKEIVCFEEEWVLRKSAICIKNISTTEKELIINKLAAAIQKSPPGQIAKRHPSASRSYSLKKFRLYFACQSAQKIFPGAAPLAVATTARQRGPGGVALGWGGQTRRKMVS